MRLILNIIILAVIISSLASAVLLSDQGTNVRETATGNLLSLGNLTIEIYDSSTAGNLIFNQSFGNVIANGSWNIMISPELEFGKIYWKDYKINNENLDFDGNDRLEFQSPLGKINNASFINFSLINSCPEGSSIRLIYENGSVVCETDDSGSVNSVNLTNYALKNQSETFTGNATVQGNITTSQTGFFGWLGSVLSRITKIFVQDIDASGNINATGNVTASYFIGNGSLLTGISSSSGSSYNATYAGCINNASYLSTFNATYDTLNATYGIYWYNMTSASSYNETYAANIANNSFNQTLTDSLYSSKTWDYNQTTPANTYTDSVVNAYNASWTSTYNATYATSVANNSWNETRANALYAGIIWGYNMTTPFTNWQSTFAYNYNQTIEANKTIFNTYNSIWSSTYNTTYDALNSTYGKYWYNYSLVSPASVYNSTYATWLPNYTLYSPQWYNQTTPANTYSDTKVGTADLHTHNALNITSPFWVNKTGDSMTGSLNMSSNNVTSVNCIIFASGGKICSA